MALTSTDTAWLLVAPREVDAGCREAVDALLERISQRRTLAEARHEPDVVVRTWVAEALTHTHAGRLTAAFDAALNAVRGLSGQAEAARTDVEECLGDLFRYQGDDESAEEAYSRAMTAAIGDQAFRVMAGRAAVQRRMGRLAEAAADFDLILSRRPIPETTPAPVVAGVLMNAASTDWQVGRPALALERLDAAERWAAGGPSARLLAWAGVLRGWVHASLGAGERAWRAGLEALEYAGPGQVEVRNSASRLLAALAIGETPDPAREGVQIEALKVEDHDERVQIAREALEATLAEAEAEGRIGAERELHRVLAEAAAVSGDLLGEVSHRRAMDRLSRRLPKTAKEIHDRNQALRIELARNQAELDQLRVRERLLADANAALAQVDASRVRLLQTVAHDLRGPLTALMSVVEMTDIDDPQDVSKSLQTVDHVATRVVRLIDEALSDASIHAGEAQLNQVPTDLAAVVRSTIKTFAPLIAARDQRVEVALDEDLRGNVDADAFARIVENLLANAIKYTPDGGTVHIAVQRDEGMVRLEVLDPGPGFVGLDPAAGLLFGHQLASAEQAPTAGWGIGLHTVYQLVTRLGGLVEIGNRPEGGAHVRVRLPAAPR